MAEILAPSSVTVDRKFELRVDQWKFVGHPFSLQSHIGLGMFSVVFVLQVRFLNFLVMTFRRDQLLVSSDTELCILTFAYCNIVYKITANHRSFSDLITEMTVQILTWLFLPSDHIVCSSKHIAQTTYSCSSS